MFGMFFLGVLYLQRVLGYDALEIGLAFLPTTLVMGTLSVALRRAADHALRRAGDADSGARPDRRRPGAVRDGPGRRQLPHRRAAIELAAGHRGRALLPGADDAGDVGRHPEDAGLASGLVNTTEQVGGAVGSVLATLSATRTDTLLAAGDPTAEALTGGYQLPSWSVPAWSC